MNDLEQLYQQIILDAARERHGAGLLQLSQGESFQVNPTCGDQVKMQVKLSADGSKIEQIGWEGHGCSISQASISIMNDLVEDITVAEFEELYNMFRKMMDTRGAEVDEDSLEILQDAAAFHGVSKFPARIKCALLGWMALREAIDQAYEAKEGKVFSETKHCG